MTDLDDLAAKVFDLTTCKDASERNWKVMQYIEAGYTFITFSDTEDIFYYDEKQGIYRPAESLIKTEIVKALDRYASNHAINEIISLIKIRSFKERTDFDVPPEFLCCKNMVLNLKTGSAGPHTPNVVFFNQLPIVYDPTAMCPTIDQFFQDIFLPGDILVIEEVLGYCLLRSYMLHKAIMLYGESGGGKTTFLNLLTAFLGRENIANESLQALVYRRFSAYQLYNKLANIFDDLPDISLSVTGGFKMATGESPMNAERKFKDPFAFYNYAKILQACNELPEVENGDYAFFRRWIIIQFIHNLFEEGKAIPNFIARLTTSPELSGLLNKAMHGLQRLLKNSAFSKSESVDTVMRFWMREANNVDAFLQDCCEFDPVVTISKEALYNAYVDYCLDHDEPAYADNIFAKKLKQLAGSKIKSLRATKGDKRKTMWEGIILKSTSLDPSPPSLDPQTHLGGATQ